MNALDVVLLAALGLSVTAFITTVAAPSLWIAIKDWQHASRELQARRKRTAQQLSALERGNWG